MVGYSVAHRQAVARRNFDAEPRPGRLGAAR